MNITKISIDLLLSFEFCRPYSSPLPKSPREKRNLTRRALTAGDTSASGDEWNTNKDEEVPLGLSKEERSKMISDHVKSRYLLISQSKGANFMWQFDAFETATKQ